jgi:hypothetical protein
MPSISIMIVTIMPIMLSIVVPSVVMPSVAILNAKASSIDGSIILYLSWRVLFNSSIFFAGGKRVNLDTFEVVLPNCHDIQHNDTQHDDCQHNNKNNVTLSESA